jgi:NAD(P)H-flavin reductase
MVVDQGVYHHSPLRVISWRRAIAGMIFGRCGIAPLLAILIALFMDEH